MSQLIKRDMRWNLGQIRKRAVNVEGGLYASGYELKKSDHDSYITESLKIHCFGMKIIVFNTMTDMYFKYFIVLIQSTCPTLHF